jgi:MFS family permease
MLSTTQSALAAERLRLLRQDRSQLTLVTSNSLAAVSGRMQLLLHGWLIVAWGNSLFLLAGYAVARYLPKIVLTVPAGLLCDHFERPRLLAASRWLSSIACLLPLAGFVSAHPLPWLVAGVVLSGCAAAFDQPARKATLGDITAREHIGPMVALNNGGDNMAALLGTMFAAVLGPPGLVGAAGLLAAGAILAGSIKPAPREAGVADEQWRGMAGFFRFMTVAPVVAFLICLAIAPLLLNKGVALALPSFDGSSAFVALALIAPEVGGLAVAAALFLRPVNLPLAGMVASLVLYGTVLVVAIGVFPGSVLLVLGMALGGICQGVLDTTSQVRLQELVPAGLRGRVFAL